MSRRWKAVRSRWTDALTEVGWDDFERRVADYYRGQGYRVEHAGTGATRAMSDGGIDIKLYRDDEYVVVQCKHWNVGQVPHNAVHELIGVMHTEGAQRAILISSGEFTNHAMRSAAKYRPIQLIGGEEVRRMLGPLPTMPPAMPPMPPVDDRPSWVGGPRRGRRQAPLSMKVVASQAAAMVAVLFFGYLLAMHVMSQMGKSLIQSTQQNAANARARASVSALPAPRHGYGPSYVVTSRGSSVTYAPVTDTAALTPIATPEGKPVVTGTTPRSKEGMAAWQRENEKAMKILEKTTREL